jgi:hypothetical protein
MNKIKLNPGDIYCPKCGGIGRRYDEQKSGGWTFSEECNVCLGAGKLDWIEQVVGKPRNWIEIDLSEELARKLSEDLAKEIDREILESIYKEAEQIQKEEIDDN